MSMKGKSEAQKTAERQSIMQSRRDVAKAAAWGDAGNALTKLGYKNAKDQGASKFGLQAIRDKWGARANETWEYKDVGGHLYKRPIKGQEGRIVHQAGGVRDWEPAQGFEDNAYQKRKQYVAQYGADKNINDQLAQKNMDFQIKTGKVYEVAPGIYSYGQPGQRSSLRRKDGTMIYDENEINNIWAQYEANGGPARGQTSGNGGNTTLAGLSGLGGSATELWDRLMGNAGYGSNADQSQLDGYSGGDNIKDIQSYLDANPSRQSSVPPVTPAPTNTPIATAASPTTAPGFVAPTASPVTPTPISAPVAIPTLSNPNPTPVASALSPTTTSPVRTPQPQPKIPIKNPTGNTGIRKPLPSPGPVVTKPRPVSTPVGKQPVATAVTPTQPPMSPRPQPVVPNRILSKRASL